MIHPNVQVVCNINVCIVAPNIYNCILVQASTTNIFQRQYCESMYTESAAISIDGNVSRMPF